MDSEQEWQQKVEEEFLTREGERVEEDLYPKETAKRSLNKGHQFRKVFRTGRTFRGRSFRAVYILNTLGFFRLGFSLSAKSGNAVKRNLLRRRIRSLASRENIGADIVILPVGKLRKIEWRLVKSDFAALVERIKATGRDGDEV